jgi:hypothetical protein
MISQEKDKFNFSAIVGVGKGAGFRSRNFIKTEVGVETNSFGSAISNWEQRKVLCDNPGIFIMGIQQL